MITSAEFLPLALLATEAPTELAGVEEHAFSIPDAILSTVVVLAGIAVPKGAPDMAKSKELVKLLKSFKTKYAGDTEWTEIRAGFPKTWPI